MDPLLQNLTNNILKINVAEIKVIDALLCCLLNEELTTNGNLDISKVGQSGVFDVIRGRTNDNELNHEIEIKNQK